MSSSLARDEDYSSEEYGWKVKLNHVFREKRDQYFKPRLSQLIPLLPFSIRYAIFWLKLWRQNKLPFIDGARPLQVEFYQGVPIGGIGSGSIGRGFHGEFCRYHMIPGIYHHQIVFANQFIVSIRRKGRPAYQQVLSPYFPSAKTFSSLSSWNWGFNGEFGNYRALYPQSWTTYELPGQNVVLICRQISPVIPHNYKDSCLPTAVFQWTVLNKSSEPIDVSITFTFKNGIGCEKVDRAGGCWTEAFSKNQDGVNVKGVSIHQTFRETMPCSYNIAAVETETVAVTHCLAFDPLGCGDELWKDLLDDGKLSSSEGKSEVTSKGSEIAAAVSCFTSIQPNQQEKMDVCLSWDMPKINFRENRNVYKRFYTRWFGDEGEAGPTLCHYALKHHTEWKEKIDSWQESVLSNKKLESWYKSALFNELYFISDGGSLWLEMPFTVSTKDVRHEYGRFAYLESHEYRMYNTYDVHFYASFALAMLWPKLQLSLQYDFADTISYKSNDSICYLMEGTTSLRKSVNSVPHDLGDPEEEPWIKINGYRIHDVSRWKDLNAKFVLQVHRDYVFTKDDQYLRDMWPHVQAVMETSLTFDIDSDGLIENDGCADQTFDTWIMTGASAYCGCLWLAAVHAVIKMAVVVGNEEVSKKYSDILERGKKSFDKKLWAGSYYKFDSSNGTHANTIMADQLCGHWYHKASMNSEPFLPQEKISQSLRTVFDYNVMKNKGGTSGAVNGMTPAGKIDLFTLQSEETWIGVTYGLAATLIHEGFWKEGMLTAEGMYRTIYEALGLGFQTPEAIYQQKHYRAPGYMRPLAIWAIQWAVQNVK